MSNKFDDPHPASSFERISKLVFDLEQELMMISNESAKVVALKDEMNHLKKLLSTVDKPQETSTNLIQPKIYPTIDFQMPGSQS